MSVSILNSEIELKHATKEDMAQMGGFSSEGTIVSWYHMSRIASALACIALLDTRQGDPGVGETSNEITPQEQATPLMPLCSK